MGYKKPPTKNPGSTLTAQEWNTYVRANMEQAWNVGNKYDYAQIVQSADPYLSPPLEVPRGTTADIPWDGVTYPLGGGTPADYFDSTLNAMVVPEPGVYQVTCSWRLLTSFSGNKDHNIRIVQYRNAAVVRYAEWRATMLVTQVLWYEEVTGMFTARAGDYFRVVVSNIGPISGLPSPSAIQFDNETYFEMRYMGDYGVD